MNSHSRTSSAFKQAFRSLNSLVVDKQKKQLFSLLNPVNLAIGMRN
ncbi:hypothetical protein FDUTEX481_08733 [Tolypothrix sp. PCC 7601]|nr:hypothetical protein FDUTEX481_08733 [Tolypothrix sp. PCC 7601]